MVFDWGEYLPLARFLSARPDDASRRAAISRAHYACYGVAATYAIRHGFAHRVVTHDRIWSWFRQTEEPSGRDVNALGKRLKARRVSADYHADDQRIAEQADVICVWAEESLTLLAALPEEGPNPEPPSDT